MGKSNIDKFLDLCNDTGCKFLSISVPYDSDEFVVYIHDPKRAGMLPKLENVRDDVDFKYLLNSWYERGKVRLSKNKNFSKAIKLAIETLYLHQGACKNGY